MLKGATTGTQRSRGLSTHFLTTTLVSTSGAIGLSFTYLHTNGCLLPCKGRLGAMRFSVFSKNTLKKLQTGFEPPTLWSSICSLLYPLINSWTQENDKSDTEKVNNNPAVALCNCKQKDREKKSADWCCWTVCLKETVKKFLTVRLAPSLWLNHTTELHRVRHTVHTAAATWQSLASHFCIFSPIFSPNSFVMATFSCCVPPPSLLLLLLLPFPSAESVDLVVATKSGQVRGTALSVRGGQVRAFLGIPYGNPPVGNLRFRAPQPVDAWEGVRNATQFSNTCFQLAETTYPGRRLARYASRHRKIKITFLWKIVLWI